MNDPFNTAAGLVRRIQSLTTEFPQPQAIRQCKELFAELKALPDLPAVNQLIFQVYADIVKGYGAAQMPAQAEEIYHESLQFPRRADMEWEQHWVTVKMIEALLSSGQTDRAQQLTDKFKASVKNDAQDQAWLNYYMKGIDDAFAYPENIYRIPKSETGEDPSPESISFNENKSEKPDLPTWETEGRDFWCTDYDEYNKYAFLRKPKTGRNLWQQPGAFTPSTRPRTEEEITHFEKRMGYRLPELFREHLKVQNGRTLRYETYVYGDYASPELYEGDIQGIPETGGYYETLSDTYGTYMEREMWDEALGKGSNPDRLHVLSYLDGHSILCLDYGVLTTEPREQPEVVIYNTEDNFKEELRVNSYSDFIKRLVYNETAYFVGLKTSMTLDEVKDHLTATLLPDPSKYDKQQRAVLESLHINFQFKRKEYDPHYIWDYDYHYVAVTVVDSKRYILRLMPNKYRGGNHAFQDDTQYNLILEIEPSDGAYGRAMVGPVWIERLIEKFADERMETKILLPE